MKKLDYIIKLPFRAIIFMILSLQLQKEKKNSMERKSVVTKYNTPTRNK